MSTLSRIAPLDEQRRARLRQRLGLSIGAPRGWEAGPPDFVGIGSQRCGTTWWFRQIARHPRVVTLAGKEQHYFDRFWKTRFTDADVSRYHELFPRPAGAVTGEWTPRYIHDPWTLPLLRRAAPASRVLVLLRDPWERFLSGIRHDSRVLERKLRGQNREYLELMINGDAFQRSLYSDQIRRALRAVDRSRLLILQYERCVAEPQAELERTFEFLGLDGDAVEVEAGDRSPARPPQPEPTVAGEIRAALASDVGQLVEVAPEIDPERWPSCR
jgi:hypothetical protein